tara:strand:- start:75 stop:314 length:240 start_codon:yes stop_codon:yes gene_type:complete
MQDKLEMLITIKRVSPPDYLYDKIIERINNKIQAPLIYAYAACIILLIAFNIFSFNLSIDNNLTAINLIDMPTNFLQYE